MPRFHYNIYDGTADLDHKGMELLNWSEARLEAIRRSGMIIKANAEAFALGKDWRMEVTDSTGLLLFRLDFSVLTSPAVAGTTQEKITHSNAIWHGLT